MLSKHQKLLDRNEEGGPFHIMYSTTMARPFDMNNGRDLHHNAIINKNVPGDFTT